MCQTFNELFETLSLPSQGAWIEIVDFQNKKEASESLPSQGAWIEIFLISSHSSSNQSLPSQGAWIEISSFNLAKLARKGRSLHRERGLKSLY